MLYWSHYNLLYCIALLIPVPSVALVGMPSLRSTLKGCTGVRLSCLMIAMVTRPSFSPEEYAPFSNPTSTAVEGKKT